SSSGKPCPRLIALCSSASADMTVKIVVPMSANNGFACAMRQAWQSAQPAGNGGAGVSDEIGESQRATVAGYVNHDIGAVVVVMIAIGIDHKKFVTVIVAAGHIDHQRRQFIAHVALDVALEAGEADREAEKAQVRRHRRHIEEIVRGIEIMD